MRSCQKLTPGLIKAVLAGSETDLLLANAKPTSDSGSTSGITELRKGRKQLWVRQQLGRGVRRRERNNSADTKVSEGGGGREAVPDMSEQRAFPCSS